MVIKETAYTSQETMLVNKERYKGKYVGKMVNKETTSHIHTQETRLVQGVH